MLVVEEYTAKRGTLVGQLTAKRHELTACRRDAEMLGDLSAWTVYLAICEDLLGLRHQIIELDHAWHLQGVHEVEASVALLREQLSRGETPVRGA